MSLSDSHLKKSSRPADGGLDEAALCKAFFENAGVGNAVCDPATSAIYRANAQFCEIVGCSPEDLSELPLTALCQEEMDLNAWTRWIRDPQLDRIKELEITRKDGSRVWVQLIVTASADKDAAPSPVFCVMRDISQRRTTVEALEHSREELEQRVQRRTRQLADANAALSAEVMMRAQVAEELRSANRNLETVIGASPVPLIVTDSKNIVTVWNDAAEKLFGWKSAEVVGLPLPIVPPGPYGLRERQQINTANLPIHFETRRMHKDKRLVEVILWIAALVGPSNEIVGHARMFIDVTERKFLEKALLDASEREQRRIGQDLHDGLCQHLLGAAFGVKAVAIKLSPEESEGIAQLQDLAHLINDAVTHVRDVTRGLNPVELDALGLMAALQELAACTNKSLPCVFECENSVLVKNPEVALNAYRITQEAIANAMKHSQAKSLRICLKETGKNISLQIIDDGVGFPETPPPHKGMGLETMKYRTNAIGGELRVASSPGVGVRVICSFPK